MLKHMNRSIFVDAAISVLGCNEIITRKEMIEVCKKTGVTFPNWITNSPEYAISRGVYTLPLQFMSVKYNKTTDAFTEQSFISNKIPDYVSFGHYSDIRTIVKSKLFYPIFITGQSGSGKTMMVDQVCANENRELIRVNVTIETDEDDLLGGFRLLNGQTVWNNGPVVTAMERGAILLLDEVDLGSNKIMCLQSTLEGNSIFLKKIGKTIFPTKGFNIIATANTKGKGTDDGRYIGTNVLNEAFLERFPITIEQNYPNSKIEEKILENVMNSVGINDTPFITLLIKWADVIRKSYNDGAVSEIISTRRLVHICEAYSIFGMNRKKALTLCLNRFDIDTMNTFMDLYKKIDESIDPLDIKNNEEQEEFSY